MPSQFSMNVHTSGSYKRGRPDGVTHGDPAAARCLVHDERGAILVEQQILVSEQCQIRLGFVGILDERRGTLEIGRTRRRDRRFRGAQQAPQRVRGGSHGREQQGAKTARRRRFEGKLPPQFLAVRHVPIREEDQPERCAEHQQHRHDPGRGEALFDQGGAPAKALPGREQHHCDCAEYRRLLVIESLEQREQDAGAQQPHRQIPRRIEPPVQAVREHQESDPDGAAQQM